MSAGGYIGSGLKMAYSTTSPFTWIQIEQVLDVTLPELLADKVETTTHGAAFHRSIPGLRDVGDTAVMLLTDHSAVSAPGQAALRTLSVSKATVWFRFELPASRDPVTDNLYRGIEFQAAVSGHSFTAGIAARQETKVTLRFDGTSFTTFAQGASQIT